eukprot:364706-Chlamydomonas_euryale.AAC.1
MRGEGEERWGRARARQGAGGWGRARRAGAGLAPLEGGIVWCDGLETWETKGREGRGRGGAWAKTRGACPWWG